MSSSRAVAPVIGVVVLLALSMLTITAILFVGASTLADIQADSHTSNMENSMAQMSSKVSLVALGGSSDQSFDLGNIREGRVRVEPNAGRVKLVHEPVNASTVELFNDSYGAMVYIQDDIEIAFQGGGVWKKEQSSSHMVSPPLEDTVASEAILLPLW